VLDTCPAGTGLAKNCGIKAAFLCPDRFNRFGMASGFPIHRNVGCAPCTERRKDGLHGCSTPARIGVLYRTGSIEIGKNRKQAASIEGAFRFGRSVLPDNMREIDLIVCGTVAVNLDGARIGKGGGYSDLEFGLAREVGLVRQKTPVVTTVHDLQVLDDKLSVLVHDIPVDVIVTPTRVIQTHTQLPRPKGIYWDYLPEEKIDEIPYLKHLRLSKIK